MTADLGEYVEARSATLCRHGSASFCWDDATPAEREAVDFLHRHAYAYATSCGIDRDTAETYATWTVAESWSPDVVRLDGDHRHEFARFRDVTRSDDTDVRRLAR